MRGFGVPATLLTVTFGVVGVLVYAGFNWPSDSKPGAQATLAAALIGLLGTIGSVAVRSAFDQLTLITQHRLNVQSRMLDRFYDYAGHYVMPLAAAAAETARYLGEYGTETGSRQAEKLDCAFYSAAQYIRLYATLKNTFSLPNVDPPLGILMSSHEAEERIWQITPQPWVFGVSSLADESLLVAAVTTEDGKLRPAAELIGCSHDSTSPLHRIRQTLVTRVTSDPVLLRDLISVLNTLSLLINFELGKVYAPWYSDSRREPKEELAIIAALPAKQKRKLGVLL